MADTTGELRILILEDVPTDAELIEHELHKEGISFRAQRVDSRDGFEQAIEDFKPDVVLADYRLPGFSGSEALAMVRRRHPEVPVIIVTGTIGDESAVELVHQGARDYVLKDNLGRLGHAIQRSLAVEEGIRARKAAEQATRDAERRYHGALDNMLEGCQIIDHDWHYLYLNDAAVVQARKKRGKLIGHTLMECFPGIELTGLFAALQGCMNTVIPRRLENEFTYPDGTTAWFDLRIVPIPEGLFILSWDITERIQTEARIRDLARFPAENPSPVLRIGSDGLLQYANEASAPLLYNFGLSVGGRVPPEWVQSVTEALLAERGRELEIQCDGHIYAFVLAPIAEEGYTNFYGRDITERKQAEITLRRSNRALRTLSASNGNLIHAANESDLLHRMCSTIVDIGGYLFTWIGFVEQDGVRPVAQAGLQEGQLDSVKITWSDTALGCGLISRAIWVGEPQIARDINHNPAYAPLRDEAQRHGYTSMLALPLRSEGDEVFGSLSIYSADVDIFDENEVRVLTEMADDLAFGIRMLRTRLEHERLQVEHLKSAEQLEVALTDTIRAIALTVEKRDPYTAGHQNKVAQLCVGIGRELGLDANRLEGLRLGATIHDIGKVYVPAEILNRPGKLTQPEFEIIQSHPQVGYDIVKDVHFPWPVAQMILQHHERLDGSGYPMGLKDDEIILEARILAVADVVDAMTSHRPYRPGRGIEAALAEIRQHRGTLYDTAVVDACLRLFDEKQFQFS